ncbi:ABC transporter [Sphaerisporangium rufum]|uniref:ABC transporter n=1 Tax=Sphaerisporangium rufum TaxID=1381558 RepID=A0A919UZM4_9ACTN|nr:ABC transporter [Sphaerisporangium rufum]
MRGAVLAEWTKFSTVRSTWWALGATVVLSAALGYLVALSLGGGRARGAFDPLFAAFYGLTLAQLALVTFGVTAVGAEYSAGTIRASLAAVPRRGVFYAGKVLAVALPAAGVSAVAAVAAFLAAQPALGPRGVGLGAPGTVEALVGGCAYLTLICLFATGVTTMLRGSARALGILMPLLFLGSQGLGNMPQLKPVMQYLPDQLGMVIIHVSGPPDDPRWARAYGPWTGLALLVVWVTAALVGGYLVLRRRDA